jgi:3-ketosteroid 9alpha-monooxygenase subunit A
MVDRFEYELDTTHSHEAWMKEVEANLAAQSAVGAGR